MRFAPDRDNAAYTIRSYNAQQVSVIAPAGNNDEAASVYEVILTHSFIISPQRLVEDWLPENLQELTSAHLQQVADLTPELVILGTGRTLQFPTPALTESLLMKGIGVEIMDTAAACRTYNVLMHEGRHVVAALILD